MDFQLASIGIGSQSFRMHLGFVLDFGGILLRFINHLAVYHSGPTWSYLEELGTKTYTDINRTHMELNRNLIDIYL